MLGLESKRIGQVQTLVLGLIDISKKVKTGNIDSLVIRELYKCPDLDLTEKMYASYYLATCLIG